MPNKYSNAAEQASAIAINQPVDPDELIIPNHPHADQRNWMPGDDDDGLPFDTGDDAWPPILTKETLDAILADPQFRMFVLVARIVVLARRQGAHIRALADLFGGSKSSWHRWLWLYEQIGTASLARPKPPLSESEEEDLRMRWGLPSQTGQNGDEKPNTSNEPPSQMGQGGRS